MDKYSDASFIINYPYCFLCMECILHTLDEHKLIMKKLFLLKLESKGWGSTLINDISRCNT